MINVLIKTVYVYIILCITISVKTKMRIIFKKKNSFENYNILEKNNDEMKNEN